jgi:hypothetical protein
MGKEGLEENVAQKRRCVWLALALALEIMITESLM